MKNKYFHLVIFLIIGYSAAAQETVDPYAVRDSIAMDEDIFDLENPAEITLKYDMKEFRKRLNADKYLDAELTYYMGDSIPDIQKTVRIKARGNNRKEVCQFPPISINISKSDIINKKLKDAKKIKLVTHCGGSKAHESYVLKEFLAYKIYNLISPYSFRVRLVDVKYIDTSRKNRQTESWAILIEPESMLAERLEFMTIKNNAVGLSQTNKEWTRKMAIFQYMIGNSDYSIAGRHNVKLLRDNDVTNFNVFPIPYDFDYCGMVNAHYAVPGETLGLNSVKERYFLGPCSTNQEYLEIINSFLSLKEEIMDLIGSFEYLAEGSRTEVINYLDEFFTRSNDSRYIDRYILSTCR